MDLQNLSRSFKMNVSDVPQHRSHLLLATFHQLSTSFLGNAGLKGNATIYSVSGFRSNPHSVINVCILNRKTLYVSNFIIPLVTCFSFYSFYVLEICDLFLKLIGFGSWISVLLDMPYQFRSPTDRKCVL